MDVRQFCTILLISSFSSFYSKIDIEEIIKTEQDNDSELFVDIQEDDEENGILFFYCHEECILEEDEKFFIFNIKKLDQNKIENLKRLQTMYGGEIYNCEQCPEIDEIDEDECEEDEDDDDDLIDDDDSI